MSEPKYKDDLESSGKCRLLCMFTQFYRVNFCTHKKQLYIEVNMEVLTSIASLWSDGLMPD